MRKIQRRATGLIENDGGTAASIMKPFSVETLKAPQAPLTRAKRFVLVFPHRKLEHAFDAEVIELRKRVFRIYIERAELGTDHGQQCKFR